jgi:hypothetical protein
MAPLYEHLVEVEAGRQDHHGFGRQVLHMRSVFLQRHQKIENGGTSPAVMKVKNIIGSPASSPSRGRLLTGRSVPDSSASIVVTTSCSIHV